MPDIKTIRVAFIVVEAIIVLCAIVAAFLKIVYLAAGLIVLDGIIIFLGSIFITRKYNEEEIQKLKRSKKN